MHALSLLGPNAADPNGTLEAWRQPAGGLDRYFLKLATMDSACAPAPLDGKLVMPGMYDLPFGLGAGLAGGKSYGGSIYGGDAAGGRATMNASSDVGPPAIELATVTATAAHEPLTIIDLESDVSPHASTDVDEEAYRYEAALRAHAKRSSGRGDDDQRCYEPLDVTGAEGRKGYMAGVNQPGVSYQFLTSLPSRWEPMDSGWSLAKAKQPHAATQLAQSAYAPLLTPYVLVGLGQTHDYVEELAVGLPSGARRSFQQAIIPNSRLVVLPYPHDQPARWELRLYLEPRQQLYVFLAFCATLLLLGVLVLILEVRERIQDSREKRALAPALPL